MPARIKDLITDYRARRSKKAIKKLSTRSLIHTLDGWVVAFDDVLDGFLRFRITLEDIMEELQRRHNRSTIEDDSVILEILQSGGYHEDDPIPTRIYEYEHPVGMKTLYVIFYHLKDCAPMGKKSVLLWDEGVTKAGLAWMKERGCKT